MKTIVILFCILFCTCANSSIHHGKFPDRTVFMLIQDASVTQAMVNHSTSLSKAAMPLNSSTDDRMLETGVPVDSIYDAYTWLTLKEARAELLNVGW